MSSEKKPSSSSSELKLFGVPLKDTEEVLCDKKIECPFCNRKFQNLQALGGHQNAHRRERQMARLAPFQYMHSQMLQQRAAKPSNLPRVLSTPPVFGGATWFWKARASSELLSAKLPVVEPPGTHHHRNVDDNIDLELRLATTSNESGR